VLYGCAKCHTCKGGQAEERRRLQGAGGATPGIGRRRRLSRQDVEGWNAELVAALRNTTALASANHSRVNQYQLAAALREIHFAGLQADD
jgi:hypothetical protein